MIQDQSGLSGKIVYIYLKMQGAFILKLNLLVMKEIILNGLLIALCTVILFSCQKTKVSPERLSNNSKAYDFRTDKRFEEIFGAPEMEDEASNKRSDLEKLIEVAKIESNEARKIAYSLLTTEERIDFWNYVIEYHITEGTFTDDQKKLLRDVKSAVVKPNIFENRDLQEVLGTEFLPLFIQQFKEIGITRKDAVRIFVEGSVLNRPLPVNPKMEDCGCNTTSSFGCSGCVTTEYCLPSMFGCGFLSFFNCNGACPSLNGFYLPTGVW
jgi:hypothetical protein